MEEIQLIFDKKIKAEHDKKAIMSAIKNALANSENYQKALEELEQKKEIAESIKNEILREFTEDYEKLEKLKEELSKEKEELTILALKALTDEGETVQVTNKKGETFEAEFEAKFKKISKA